MIRKFWRWFFPWEWEVYVDFKQNAIDSLRLEKQRLVEEMKLLQEKIAKQAWDLKWQQEANRRKNIEMDALHFVWCNGGCKFGVHRFDHGELTEEIVTQAERNTKRLRQWWINMPYKKIYYK